MASFPLEASFLNFYFPTGSQPARIQRTERVWHTRGSGPRGDLSSAMYGGYGGGRGGGRGGRSKNVWVRPGSTPATAPSTQDSKPTTGKAGSEGGNDARPDPAAIKPPPSSTKGATLSASARSYTPASNGDKGGAGSNHVGQSFLPVGVKRKTGEGEDGAAGPKRQHMYVDPALQEKQRKAAEAKAELEAKIAAAKEEAERMKRSIQEAAAKAKAKKEEAQREEWKRKELERKEMEMEKQKKQKAASNLLSGFAAARKKHGVGTADGPKPAAEPEVELTQEEKDRQEVRRVMMATSDWQVLNLVPNAQPKWVKQAYRELAKVLHPDKCKAPGAKDAFQKLSKAYQNINAMQA